MCMHTQTTQSTTHKHTHKHTHMHTHILQTKRLALSPPSVSFPFLSSLPTSSFPLCSCPVWPPPAGSAGLDCDLVDRCETASYESVLIAPFIDSCFLNGSKCETPEGLPELSGCVESQPVQLKRCTEGLTERLSSVTEGVMAGLFAKA